jgi:hypothetical protein
MRTDMRVAGFANGRMGLEDLLHHRAKQAGEFRQATLKNRHPEIDVTQKALQGIMQSAIGSPCKQAVRHRRKMTGGGERERFLALEVMEEAALGQPGGQANVIDGHCRVAFGTDRLRRRPRFSFSTRVAFGLAF